MPRRDALKVLRTDVSADADYRNRFEREADFASTLWHPNIVGLHDRGEVDGHLWITMDFVDGLNAAELIAQRYPGGMPAELVIKIAGAVASALDYAHKQGLLHRDVKPANIMVAHPDDDGEHRVLLADFGIARKVDDISGLTATNMTVGTIAYAAPEQLMGEHVDGRADQYALAATVYQLLTGSQLYPHSNSAVVISRHLNTPPPKLSNVGGNLALFDPPLAVALSKDPNHRYARCSDFARALVEQTRQRRVQLAWGINATGSCARRPLCANKSTHHFPPPSSASRRVRCCNCNWRCRCYGLAALDSPRPFAHSRNNIQYRAGRIVGASAVGGQYRASTYSSADPSRCKRDFPCPAMDTVLLTQRNTPS